MNSSTSRSQSIHSFELLDQPVIHASGLTLNISLIHDHYSASFWVIMLNIKGIGVYIHLLGAYIYQDMSSLMKSAFRLKGDTKTMLNLTLHLFLRLDNQLLQPHIFSCCAFCPKLPQRTTINTRY